MQLCNSLAAFRANESTEAHLRYVFQVLGISGMQNGIPPRDV